MNSTSNSLLCSSILLGGSSWSPADLSNKVGFWWASSVGGSPTDGDSITAWPDSYGLLSDATGSATYRTGANGIGGQPALEFNGSTNGFGTGYTGTPTDFFCWAVFNMGTVNNYEALMGNEYPTGFMVCRFSFDAELSTYLMGTSGVQKIALTGPGYFLFGRYGTTKVFEHNATIDSRTGSGTSMAGNELALGRWGMITSSGRLAGKMSAAGFLDAYPSAEDLTNLRTWITNTYGIATS